MTLSRWLMAISVLLLAACSSTPNDQEPEQMAQQASASHLSPPPDIPNTSRCQNAGGSMTLTTQLDGSAVPMCQLANGKRF